MESLYIYDGVSYTEEELIDFAQAASEYDRRDSDAEEISTVGEALRWLQHAIKINH